VELYVAGEKLDAGGVLMDFGEIKKKLAEVMKLLDHKFLNEQDAFGEGYPPSSENIATFIGKQMQQRIDKPGVRVHRVSAWESENSCATYICEH
jgi:6-pyruvoyltetrahydropterin/6-carboxytetrahydropterin synthase